jgi:hypothetical protein
VGHHQPGDDIKRRNAVLTIQKSSAISSRRNATRVGPSEASISINFVGWSYKMRKLLFALPWAALSAAAPAQESGNMPPYTYDPGPHAGNWESTLTGTGQSDDDFDNSNFGVTGSVGHYFTKNFIVTFKQGIQANETRDSTLVNGRSVVQAAYQWDFAKWQPYLGINVGGIYGAGIEDSAIVGPEGGLKYFVNESTFLFGSIAYEVPIDECCKDGIVPYSVGIGFDF